MTPRPVALAYVAAVLAFAAASLLILSDARMAAALGVLAAIYARIAYGLAAARQPVPLPVRLRARR